MGKLAVILEASDTVVNRAIFRCIGIAFFDQRADHLDHAADLLSRQRMGGGRFDVHAFHVFLALCNITLGNLFCRNAFLDGFLNDLIIHIREI